MICNAFKKLKIKFTILEVAVNFSFGKYYSLSNTYNISLTHIYFIHYRYKFDHVYLIVELYNKISNTLCY